VGVTSALFSGLVTASAITKKNLMKELFRWAIKWWSVIEV
jgi:hypothetical protein